MLVWVATAFAWPTNFWISADEAARVSASSALHILGEPGEQYDALVERPVVTRSLQLGIAAHRVLGLCRQGGGDMENSPGVSAAARQLGLLGARFCQTVVAVISSVDALISCGRGDSAAMAADSSAAGGYAAIAAGP
jgi:hypothetical protein